MILKHWKKNSTHYWLKVNFKNKTAYTDILQITLEDPWFLPKYKDNFAGKEGLRLYGWLFFYFGRCYEGLIYPAEDTEAANYIIDNSGKRWLFMNKDKINNFKNNIDILKKMRKNVVTYERIYDGQKFNIIANIEAASVKHK